MPIEINGFANALGRTAEFEGVPPSEVERALSDGAPLRLVLADAGVDRPLVRSGSPFTHLLFVQQGTLIPWQFPPSELRFPFLIGDHELLMGASRWMATYSATPGAAVIEIPLSSMQNVLLALPRVRANMETLVLRRLSRFYWTSLSTTGTPRSRVAAALVSRLALSGDDAGQGREVSVLQTELMRLTAMSRTAVADGLRQLVETGVINTGERRRFSGRVTVPDVDNLKDIAFVDARQTIQAAYGNAGGAS